MKSVNSTTLYLCHTFCCNLKEMINQTNSIYNKDEDDLIVCVCVGVVTITNPNGKDIATEINVSSIHFCRSRQKAVLPW